MKRILYIFVNFLIIASLASCAKDIIDVNGSIMGVVKDSDDGHLLQNCNITLSPSGKTCITGADGHFNFEELEPGTYSLSVTKTGYNDVTKTVTVVSGQSTDASVIMKSKGAFAISSNSLDFGDLNSSMTFQLVNNSDVSTSFKISDTPSWLTLSMTSGVVQQGGSLSVVANVNRDAVDYGEYGHTLTISYTGRTNGNVTLNVKMTKVRQSEPKVSIDPAATEITQNSFKIKGAIVATGGSAISSYGFCWSVAHNPTIADSKVDNGSTVETCEFNSQISNLAMGTSYYVRAYATNSLGTSYSDEIEVTTQDAASDKWDGTVAKSFAGGSGISSNPYQIKTGAQLLLVKDYSDKCFKLMNNIDLDNKNWRPIAQFTGTFDGNGFEVRNLKIDSKDEDYVGLFGDLDGILTDLTIKNVAIDGKDYVGALAGKINKHASIVKNCRVILSAQSHITGNDNVGGLAGYAWFDRGSNKIEDCCVESSASTLGVISGNNNIGGLLGKADKSDAFDKTTSVSHSTAKANVNGSKSVGGLIGYAGCPNTSQGYICSCCGAEGEVTGESEIGGLIGKMSYNNVIACKANVNLKATRNYCGGIFGGIYGSNCKIEACYTTGSIQCTGSNVAGIGYDSSFSNIIMCYSTISCSSDSFDGIGPRGKDCCSTSPTRYGKGECTNITTYLQELYKSEYDEYWNFNKTWLWEGKINGQTVKVSCPRLSWE